MRAWATGDSGAWRTLGPSRGGPAAVCVVRRPEGVGAPGYPECGWIRKILQRPHHRRVCGRHLEGGTMPGAVERRALVKERTAIHGEFSVRRQARLKEMLIDLDAIRAAGLKLGVDPHHAWRRRAGRLFFDWRLPRQHQRAEPRNASGRHGAPGEVSAAHDPGVRLRRELRQANQGTAARRDQPHVPQCHVGAAP